MPPSSDDIRPTPGVGGVALDGGCLLLVKRGTGAYAGSWAVPGGRVEHGETMRDAVKREVLEETGLHVEVGEPVWIGEAIDTRHPPRFHYTLVDFDIAVVGGSLRAGDDAVEARWVPITEVTGLALTPTMVELVNHLDLERRAES